MRTDRRVTLALATLVFLGQVVTSVLVWRWGAAADVAHRAVPRFLIDAQDQMLRHREILKLIQAEETVEDQRLDALSLQIQWIERLLQERGRVRR